MNRLYLHRHEPRKAEHIKNVNEVHAEQMTIGQRVADSVATVMGSWNFIITQATIMAVWIMLNLVAWFYHWDIYPFVLLNLAMSAQAAFATPLIMMSQNRQAEKDRLTAEHTYQNTIKEAEETRGIIEHLAAQDAELLKQTTLLEAQATRIENLVRRIDQATGRGAA